MRIALNPSTASAFRVFTQWHADERSQGFFHKQLERLQGLVKLYHYSCYHHPGAVHTVQYVCALMHTADWSTDSNSVKWFVIRHWTSKEGLVKFIWALTGYRKLLETAVIGHYKDVRLSRCSIAGLKAEIDFIYWLVSHRQTFDFCCEVWYTLLLILAINCPHQPTTVCVWANLFFNLIN